MKPAPHKFENLQAILSDASKNLGMSVRVKKVDEVFRKINSKLKKLPHASKSGLIRAAYVILRDGIVLCPVDTGNLRASGTVVWGPSGGGAPSGKLDTTAAKGNKTTKLSKKASAQHEQVVARLQGEAGEWSVFITFSAYYALYVHENLSAQHKVGMAQFLRIAAQNNEFRVVKLAATDAKKGLV